MLQMYKGMRILQVKQVEEEKALRQSETLAAEGDKQLDGILMERSLTQKLGERLVKIQTKTRWVAIDESDDESDQYDDMMMKI
jgi:hypothetical protein